MYKEITFVPLGQFLDNRGFLSSLYQKGEGVPDFVEDRLSVSTKGVLRGLHGDDITGKLFIPIYGEMQFYARSLLTNDEVFLPSFSLKNKIAIYVPPLYVNGHLSLTDETIMLYKWTHAYRGPENQYTVAYNDCTLNIPWNTSVPFNLSERDKTGKSFLEVKKYYENRIR